MQQNKILILENDQQLGKDLQEVLNQAGYETTLANTYDLAIERLTDFKPALAICDIHLGHENTGIDFVKTALPLLPQLEIIYVSASSNHLVIENASSTNPLNYIVKPWSKDQIIVAVKMAFDHIEKKYTKTEFIQKLSSTEFKIIDLISKQKKSKEIADLLFVSEKTVKNHRYNIIKKLNLPNENNSLLKWALTHLPLDK
jgi:DNA-binding NarL/FixJ family response regulator